VSVRCSSIQPLSEVPPFYLPRWNQCAPSHWRQVHGFALVRRVFDSLQFLLRDTGIATVGGTLVGVSLQVRRENGTILRVRDPYEDFLAALVGRDLGRVRFCAKCSRFFIAYRSDQKTCSTRCANRFRVEKFRRKQPEYEKIAGSGNVRDWRRCEREGIELSSSMKHCKPTQTTANLDERCRGLTTIKAARQLNQRLSSTNGSRVGLSARRGLTLRS
jgi:hypothetical protein